MADAPISPPAHDGEPDAVAIFYLLYPMLDDGDKQSSEGIHALRTVSKYLPDKTVKFMWKCLKRKPPARVSGRRNARPVNSV
jgi:hypothetical protein